MPKLILPSTRLGVPRPTASMRQTTKLRRYAGYASAVLRLGGERVSTLVGLAGLVVPLTLSRLLDLSLAWTLTALLGSLVVIVGVGGYRLFDHAERTALNFWPTWERLQDRADVLREIHDANFKGQRWGEFISQQYIGGHRQATRSDFDLAETAGFPLKIEREALRRPDNPEEFLAIADAFEATAQEWRVDERRR